MLLPSHTIIPNSPFPTSCPTIIQPLHYPPDFTPPRIDSPSFPLPLAVSQSQQYTAPYHSSHTTTPLPGVAHPHALSPRYLPSPPLSRPHLPPPPPVSITSCPPSPNSPSHAPPGAPTPFLDKPPPSYPPSGSHPPSDPPPPPPFPPLANLPPCHSPVPGNHPLHVSLNSVFPRSPTLPGHPQSHTPTVIHR